MKKKCKICNKIKNLEEFHRNNKSKDGRHIYCKNCNNKRASVNHKKLYSENKEKYLKISKEFRKKYPKKHKMAMKRWRDKLRLEVLNHYSNNNLKCACCGEKEIKFLALDHINGGGQKDRKQRGWGNAFYHNLKKNNFPKGFQVLCHNCNLAKSFYGKCPHQK